MMAAKTGSGVLTHKQSWKLFNKMAMDAEFLETTSESWKQLADRYTEKCGFRVSPHSIKTGWEVVGLAPKKPAHALGGAAHLIPGTKEAGKQMRQDIEMIAIAVLELCNSFDLRKLAGDLQEILDRGIGNIRKESDGENGAVHSS